MEGFQHILVPLDFSEVSEPTLDLALRVLGTDGRITLLFVVEWLPAVTEGAFGVYPHRRDIEKFKALAQERLESLAAARPGPRYEIEIHEGRPAPAILEMAASLGPELIVIGSHGRSMLDHLLLGSVAERVLRKSACPVLVARMPVAAE